MESVLAVFGLVFVAELGDKSQLLALAFATRYSPRQVVAGLVLAALATTTLSVAAGGLIGAAVRGPVVSAAGGVLFLVFAALALRSGDHEDGPRIRRRGGSLILTVAASVFVAELGDKTMLATMALAAREGVLATWVGSIAGFVSAGLVGVLLGRTLQDRVSERALRVLSAVLFAVFGVLYLLDAVRAL